MNVLFIGATGLVGSRVTPILQQKFDMTLTGLEEGEVGGMKVTALDITDWPAIEAAFAAGNANGERFDAVVNCAIAKYRGYRRDDPDSQRGYSERCIEVNARGAYHVFEAAARAKIPRVVYISSMTAVLGRPRYKVVDRQTHDRPRNVYAASKIFGEHVGRTYAFSDEGSMSVICLRLGHPIEPGIDYSVGLWPDILTSGTALDMHDIAPAIECSLRADVKYGVYTIVSGSEKTFIDPSLYTEIGYTPRWTFTAEGATPIQETKDTTLLEN